MLELNKIICWYSCGVTSAVAAKLILEKYKGKLPIEIVYCDTKSEHKDNERFLKDCEVWYDREIIKLSNPKYENHIDLFEKIRFINSPAGAPCTLQLKKQLRQKYITSIFHLHVFGFEYNKYEIERHKRLNKSEDELKYMYSPLIRYKLNKNHCIEILHRNNIEEPEMYKLGYNHNNCIGCPKGGKSYWNKIKIDFPETFLRMTKLERELNYRILKDIYLDELQGNEGNQKDFEFSCDMFCDDRLLNLI